MSELKERILRGFEATLELIHLRKFERDVDKIPLETQRLHADVNGKKQFKENLEVY